MDKGWKEGKEDKKGSEEVRRGEEDVIERRDNDMK